MTSLRRPVALTVAGLALSVGFGAGGAWAHSPTDFLKVPVGQQAMVLLPPMRALPGLMQVAILCAWIFMIIKTAHDEVYKLPILGELAEKSVSEQR